MKKNWQLLLENLYFEEDELSKGLKRIVITFLSFATMAVFEIG